MTDSDTTSRLAPEMDAEPDDLPPYRVRRSNRARYLRVLVTRQEGVTVVLPQGVSKQQVSPFLRQHRAWLWDQFALANAVLAGATRGQLPEFIQLAACARCYTVTYRHLESACKLSIRMHAENLELRGAVTDRRAICQALRQWLKRMARTHLVERLRCLADQHGFSFSDCSIRLQKARWGSCSGRGRINLNAKLMFLPPELVDYVLLHELAHTRHRNHSAHFWQLLKQLQPQAREAHRALRRAAELVPWWADIELALLN